MKNFYGGYSTTNLRKNIEFPENIKSVETNNKMKKRKSFNKDIYNININNFNINTKRDFLNQCSSKTIELVADFKKALVRKEEIEKKIFQNKRFFGYSSKNLLVNKNGKTKIRDRLNKNKDLINEFRSHLSPIKKNKTIELNCETDNSFFFPELIKSSYNKINLSGTKKLQTPTINKNISFQRKTNIKLLKMENYNLKQESTLLIDENTFLLSKINEYKAKIKKNSFSCNNKNINYYDENLNKFINSIKTSLNANVNSNLELSKVIINILKNIQKLEKDININLGVQKKQNYIKEKIEENNRRCNKLKKEQDLLNFELEKVKIYYKELKSKEHMLSLKYESELKAKQDKHDLITKLKYTIKKLNKSQEEHHKKRLNPVKNLKQNINLNNKYSNEINQLNLIHKFLQNQKIVLIKENKLLKKEITNKNKSIPDSNKTKELKMNYEALKKENIDKKSKIKSKEKQITILKDLINKYSKAIKEQNMGDDIFKINLDKLTREDYDDTEYKNLLIKNKIKNLINKRNNNQKMKNLEEINYIKTYESIINKKDMEISSLENELSHRNGILNIIKNKIKPLYKKENVISRTNSFLHSISDNNNNLLSSSNSKGNIGWKSKQETYYDKIRKRKNKALYMNNINNVLFNSKK